jgi:hypothetical protein
LINNVGAPLFIIIKPALHKIVEKENLQDNEDQKKLDNNDDPNLFPPRRHIPESVIVEMEHSRCRF